MITLAKFPPLATPFGWIVNGPCMIQLMPVDIQVGNKTVECTKVRNHATGLECVFATRGAAIAALTRAGLKCSTT